MREKWLDAAAIGMGSRDGLHGSEKEERSLAMIRSQVFSGWRAQ